MLNFLKNLALCVLPIFCLITLNFKFEYDNHVNQLIEEIHTLKLELAKEQLKNSFKVSIEPAGYLKHVEATPIKKWKGGKSFEYENFYATVNKVVNQFPKKIVDKKGMKALLLETACVESTFGEIVKQKGGPALGVFQMQPGTFRYLQKSSSQEEKEFMDKFKDSNLGSLDNLKYNVEFQVATALVLYSSFGVHEKKLQSKSTRAKLYKKHWNTPKGKATPSLFIKRANELLSKFYT